jgi:hypothetical protein
LRISHRRAFATGLLWIVPLLLASLVTVSGCGRSRETAEEHRKLSLRLEHTPPGKVPAGQDVEIQALVRSSLENPRLQAWLRLVGDEEDVRIPMTLQENGEARGTIPGHERGVVLRYVIEARDAAGLLVTLPRDAEDGAAFTLTFIGQNSRVLGAVSILSAVLGVLLYLGAGAAAVQSLRGRMSVGPAGLLGGLGALLIVVGLVIVGGIHALRLTGHAWPGSPLFLAASRTDLGIVTLLWIVTLILGRRTLLEEASEADVVRERTFSSAAVGLAVLLILLTLF